jgi:type 1 glutamine amidotransferase
MDFAAAGKGIVLIHAGSWYMYQQWPELNATIVGGGARTHDRCCLKFTVNAVKPDHPVMKGVPASFDVEDELYHVNPDPAQIPAGTSPIEVLAETSPSARYMKAHPSVWITSHPRARIVAIAIGHDARAHDLPAYKTLLVNAVRWAGKLP